MGDEEVIQRMRTLKLNGKRPQERQSEDRKSKKKFELFPAPGKQTPLQSSNSTTHHFTDGIKISSWSQTSRDLELRLNLPRSAFSSCFVFFEAGRVTVKTPVGRHWSCPLYDRVEEQQTRAILRGDVLLLKMNKRRQCDWPFYRLPREGTNSNLERVECTSLQEPTSTGRNVKDDFDASVEETTRVEQPKDDWEVSCETRLTVLEVTDRRVKVSAWLPGLSRETLRVEIRSFETTFTFVSRSCQKSSLDNEATKTFTIGFSLEILPHKSCWSLLSDPTDVLELELWKSVEGVWNEDTVSIVEKINSKEPDHQKHYPIQMETLPLDTSTSHEVTSWTTSSGRDASTQTAADSSTCTVNDTTLSWAGASSPVLRISPDPRVGGSNSDEQDVYFSTNGPATGGRREAQKPTCMVPPLSSPQSARGTQDPKETTHRQGRPTPSLGRPGFVGLENLGNTCFINCVLQVLANIFELKEYFLSKRYIEDINAKNPLGMGGRLASSFAQVIEALWLGEEPSFSPTLLKNLIGQKQNRFMGYLQHDAEELMELLLDGLHEDLNRVKNKLYTAHPEDQPIQDPETAASNSWSRHKSRNDSFIVDLFQGQYHSKLACPKCGKVSITFDPFSVVQVPIPKRKVVVDVVVVKARRDEMTIGRHRVAIEEESSVEQLFVEVSRVDKNLKLLNLRALEVVGSRITKMLYRTSKISNMGTLLLCEVESIEESGEPMIEVVVQQRTTLPLSSSTTRKCNTCRREDVRLRRCTRCFRVSYCNQKCQKEDWSRHKAECKMEGDDVGRPFIVALPARNTTYRRLVTTLEAFASLSVRVVRPSHRAPELIPPSLSSSNGAGDGPMVKSSINNANVDHSYTIVNGDHDANVEQSDPTTQHNYSACHPPPFSIIPCLPPPLYGQIDNLKSSKTLHQPIADQGDKPLDLGSMRFVMLLWKNNYDSKLENQLIISNKELDCCQGAQTRDEILATHLQDCFKLFTEPEILSREQSWRCSQCKSECQATKELSLWKLPPYLIIHLKRFGFSEQFFFREKIEDLIQFPTRGLDVSPYLKSRETSAAEVQDTAATSGQSLRNAWQQEHHSGSDRSPSPSSTSSTTYDLFGVINHHGGMLGGHYTSYACCYGDERSQPIGWRLFDDNHVTPCQESDVVTSSAYVLFYKQRQTPNITSSGPSGFFEGTHQTLLRRQNGQRVTSGTSTNLSLSNQMTHLERSSIAISLSYPFSSNSTPTACVSSSTSSLSLTPSFVAIGQSQPARPPRDRSSETETTSVTSQGFTAAHISSPPFDQPKPNFNRSPIISPASGDAIVSHCSLPSHQESVIIAPCCSTGTETAWSVSDCSKHPRSSMSDNNINNGRAAEDDVTGDDDGVSHKMPNTQEDGRAGFK